MQYRLPAPPPNVVANLITLMHSEAWKEAVVEMQSGFENMSKRRVTAMIDEADISQLERIAQQQRVSLAWVIRDAVSNYLSDKSDNDFLQEAGQEARGR